MRVNMKNKQVHWLRHGVIKTSQIHLLLILAYALQIVAYDASKLITPDVLLKRWFAAAALTGICVAVWYLARSQATSLNNYKILAWLIILSDIAFAAFNVYTQRGMSSRAVLLFFIPIIVSTILLSRVALFSTAFLCIAAYTTAAIAYFVNYFNEGYKIELYGEIIFYSTTFVVAAALLWTALKTKRH